MLVEKSPKIAFGAPTCLWGRRRGIPAQPAPDSIYEIYRSVCEIKDVREELDRPVDMDGQENLDGPNRPDVLDGPDGLDEQDGPNGPDKLDGLDGLEELPEGRSCTD